MTEISTESLFLRQASSQFAETIGFLRAKVVAADKLRGKEAQEFWREARQSTLSQLDELESYRERLLVQDDIGLRSLSDAIARIHRGYTEFRDHFSIAYWTATAITDFRDRINGRELVRATENRWPAIAAQAAEDSPSSEDTSEWLAHLYQTPDERADSWLPSTQPQTGKSRKTSRSSSWNCPPLTHTSPPSNPASANAEVFFCAST